VDLGVKLPDSVAGLRGKIAATPSVEQIDQADADILFVTTYGDPAGTTAPAVRGGPIWPRLRAVAANRAYEVSDDRWMLAIGVVGANAILDDIAAAVF
jgi:iron complex transport system substrate-binding protein